MNPYDTPQAPIRSSSGQSLREAPAGIFTACKGQAKWILTMSIVLTGFGALVIWAGVESMTKQSLEIELATGELPRDSVVRFIRFWVLGALFAANGVLGFLYYQGLLAFAKDRRVTVLHQAMCRMRAFTRIFAI